MGCNASSATATDFGGPPPSQAGSAAAAPASVQAAQRPAQPQPEPHLQQTQQMQQAQPQALPRPQPSAQSAGRGGNLQTAKVVQSLVSLPRSSDATLRTGEDGCHIQLKFNTLSPGEAKLWVLLKGADDASGAEASKRAFAEGQQQSLELFVCKDFGGEFGSRTEDNAHVVVELRAAEPGQGLCVVAQRSWLKLNSAGTTAQVVRQSVSCGKSERTLDPMYGTMPNPRTGAAPEGGEGECVICLSQPKEVVILHCRHVCLCKSCAAITSSTWSFQCPVCRGRVAAMVGAVA